MNKKAVSEIVSTVLIIAITIAAIGIIMAWAVPMIRNNIGSDNICSEVDVSIVSSGGYTCYQPNDITTIQVKKGNENVTVSGLKFYLSSGGNSIKYTKQIILSNNGLSVFNLNSSNISQLDKIGVVPIVKSGSSTKECAAVYLEQIPICSIGEAVFGEILNETNETCVANCSCALNIAVGQNCSNGCGGVCAGTKVPSCIDSDYGAWGTCNLGTQLRQNLTVCSNPVLSQSCSYWSYQENANEINNTAQYDVYMNYTKPANANPSSLWLIKHGSLSPYNITLPSSCWGANANKLILKFNSNTNDGGGHSISYATCYNGTVWIEVGTRASQNYYWVSQTCVSSSANVLDGDWSSWVIFDQWNNSPGQGYRNCWTTSTSLGNAARLYEEAMWWRIG